MGISTEEVKIDTNAYNPRVWTVRYVSVQDFAGQMGLSVSFVRSLCRANKIAHLRQGSKKFLINAERASRDLDRLEQANATMYSDQRSAKRASGLGYLPKARRRKETVQIRDNEDYLEALLKEAVRAPA